MPAVTPLLQFLLGHCPVLVVYAVGTPLPPRSRMRVAGRSPPSLAPLPAHRIRPLASPLHRGVRVDPGQPLERPKGFSVALTLRVSPPYSPKETCDVYICRKRDVSSSRNNLYRGRNAGHLGSSAISGSCQKVAGRGRNAACRQGSRRVHGPGGGIYPPRSINRGARRSAG
jgi:hypothetical protein